MMYCQFFLRRDCLGAAYARTTKVCKDTYKLANWQTFNNLLSLFFSQVCAPNWYKSRTKAVQRRGTTGSLKAILIRLRTPKQPFPYAHITICVRSNDCLRTPKFKGYVRE